MIDMNPDGVYRLRDAEGHRGDTKPLQMCQPSRTRHCISHIRLAVGLDHNCQNGGLSNLFSCIDLLVIGRQQSHVLLIEPRRLAVL